MKNQPNLSANLKKLMENANLSEAELARRTGIKQPIIHRLLSGENVNPKLQTLKPIAEYFLLTISQLIGEHEITSVWDGFTSSKHEGWSQVPLINGEDRKNFNCKNTKFVVTESNVRKNAFALYITDQSMEPLFPEGCIVIVEPDIQPSNGNYIIIRCPNNEILLRQLIINNEKKFINTINFKFGTIREITCKDKILGIVIRTIYDHST
jgi:transcriptional regulator with XRE-family HTH domain